MIVDIENGRLMIVTDLHGDGELYGRYRDRFYQHKKQGQADHFIILGDLIHCADGSVGQSIEMVQDIMTLQQEGIATYVMGNHELPHIYSFTLQKGRIIYTPSFEAAMKNKRDEILAFFRGLPLYLRTKAGVTLCHAGAGPTIAQQSNWQALLSLNHAELWQKAQQTIANEHRPTLYQSASQLMCQPYEQFMRHNFAITPNSPHYDDYLIGQVATSHPHFNLLWEALFTKNEKQYHAWLYNQYTQKLLENLSETGTPQNWLVTGHIDCADGYKQVNNDQLRLASGKHAQPLHTAKYLLLDSTQPITSLKQLQQGLHTIFT